MKCSNCGTKIAGKYCPECGQKYTARRISILSLLHEFLDSFFALDGSFWRNFVVILSNPRLIVENYWNGFRNYYFSPFRFIIISTLFLGLNFLITTNKFLEIKISTNSPYVTLPVVMYVIFLPIFTLTTRAIYFRFKRNFLEHLVLNSYTMAIWTIVFSIISILINEVGIDLAYNTFILLYLLSIIIWNSLIFDISKMKRVFFVLLHFSLFASLFIAIFYFGTRVNS